MIFGLAGTLRIILNCGCIAVWPMGACAWLTAAFHLRQETGLTANCWKIKKQTDTTLFSTI